VSSVGAQTYEESQNQIQNTNTFFGDDLKKQRPPPKCWCTYLYSPTSKTKTNAQLHSKYYKRTHWLLEILSLEAMENVLGGF